MQGQLSLMLEMQDRMNRKVHPDWFKQHFAWHRAVWIECGELIEHYGYKWWKHQEPDMDQVRLEVVDIWHFGMSMWFDGERSIVQLAGEKSDELGQQNLPEMPLLEAVEDLARHVLASHEFCVRRFWRVMTAAGMNPDDLYRAYVGKNVLNFFRQDNGYKLGHYQKHWQGREDNEHLVELLERLDSDDPGFEQALYSALHNRYRALVEDVDAVST